MIKSWKQMMGILGLSLGVCLGGAMTSMAANVSSVRITFTTQDGGGEIAAPEVTTSNQTEISDISWAKETEDWDPGKKVLATITLSPTDGREFSGSYSKSNCSVSGGDFSSAKKDADGNLVVKAYYYPVVYLGMPQKAGWSDAGKTRAVWRKVPHATAYQLRLYQDGNQIQTLTLEGNSVDLSQYMKKEASYYYEIRATYKDNNDRNYIKTGEYITSDNSTLEDLGDVEGNWKTYQNGKKYTDAGGAYITSSWRLILGKWYYFNADGFAVSGWNFIGDKWYYLDSNSAMRTGWLALGDKWYFMDDSGAMKTGWMQASPESWYYLNADGTMAVSTTVDGYVINDKGLYVQ